MSAIWIARIGKDAWFAKHPDLIPETRRYLQYSGMPYIIENVTARILMNPFMLCGTFFDLKVYRHRFFESNCFLFSPIHVPHHDNCQGAGKGKSDKRFVSVTGWGNAGHNDFKAMGIDWMSRKELSQAIPPAYTEYIGNQMKKILQKGGDVS